MKRFNNSGRWGICFGLACLLLLSTAGLQPAYGVYHALLVGIDRYSPYYGAGNLNSCVNDAMGMRSKLLADPTRWKATGINTKLNSAATEALIRNRLRAEAAVLRAGDVFVYFHSSHGGRSGTSTTAFLCTYNASFYDYELAAELARFNSGVKIFVIVDTCFSAGMFKDAKGGGEWNFADNVLAEYQKIVAKSNDPDKQTKALGANIAFMTASDWYQSSYAGTPYSRYTRYLIESCNLLFTDNNPCDGYRSFWEVHNYALPRVTGQSPQYRNYNLLKYTPMVAVTLGKPTPVGPSGVAQPRPLFSWSPVSGATSYEVQVFNPSRLVTYRRWIAATSYQFSTGFATGNYGFRVRAYRGAVPGPWSSFLAFSTSPTGFYIRRATLTWGANPRDLDAHLVTPTGAHIYYATGHKGSSSTAPWAKLDVDDQYSYGPENISVYQFTPVGSAVYKYYVHNYAGTGNLAGSGARVSVQGPGSVLWNCTVPGGTSSARYWHVFNMDARTGSIYPVNQLRTSAP